MKKRLLCIAAAVLMVLAAVFAFGCEKQFPSEQEVLKSHLDKYCRENGEKITAMFPIQEFADDKFLFFVNAPPAMLTIRLL